MLYNLFTQHAGTVSTPAAHTGGKGRRLAKLLCLATAALLIALCCVPAACADNRNQLVVISDLHLGADDAYTETLINKAAIADFLSEIQSSATVSELIIAGDLMDEWFLPMDYQMPESLSAFHDSIVANNQSVIDAINEILRDGQITVTYIPGNHDMLLGEAEVERIFPGMQQARDAAGLGTYKAGAVVIEHGHRYSFTCAPDPLSNTGITGGGSLLPSGYFFTRIAATSIAERMPKSDQALAEVSPVGMDAVQQDYFAYYMGWKALLTMLPIQESFSGKAIRTGIDGYTEAYAVNDIVPLPDAEGKLASVLYSDVVESWPQREAANQVTAPISAHDAILGAASAGFTDAQAQTQYCDLDPSVKVVVFGHSHVAALQTLQNRSGDDVIVTNSGSWIDHPTSGPSCTYVVITPSQDGAPITVSLRQYVPGSDGTVLQEAQINP